MTELLHHFEARGANLEALKSKAPRLLLAGPALLTTAMIKA